MIKNKILITGANGMLGQELSLYLNELFDVLSTGKRINKSTIKKCIKMDITNIDEVRSVFNDFAPNVVINCAAYTNVNLAEVNKNNCRAVNCFGLKNLISLCNKDTYIIHISSDYVFDGLKGDYLESDLTYPINYYGKTKLEAENLLIGSGYDYTILRPNVLYTTDFKKNNFLSFVYKSLKNNNKISIINDQISNPTFIPQFIRIIKDCILLRCLGIYHYGSEDNITRFGFATLIADVFNLNSRLIKPISITDYRKDSLSANRPKDSSLNTTKIKKILNIDTYSTKYFLTNFDYS